MDDNLHENNSANDEKIEESSFSNEEVSTDEKSREKEELALKKKEEKEAKQKEKEQMAELKAQVKEHKKLAKEIAKQEKLEKKKKALEEKERLKAEKENEKNKVGNQSKEDDSLLEENEVESNTIQENSSTTFSSEENNTQKVEEENQENDTLSTENENVIDSSNEEKDREKDELALKKKEEKEAKKKEKKYMLFLKAQVKDHKKLAKEIAKQEKLKKKQKALEEKERIKVEKENEKVEENNAFEEKENTVSSNVENVQEEKSAKQVIEQSTSENIEEEKETSSKVDSESKVVEENKEVEHVDENVDYSETPWLDPNNVVYMKNITRVFGTLVANNNVTLELKKGEVHALLGENGAGKSTLMSILFGLYPPTEGEIYIRGKKTVVKDPNHATSLGIGMVHQHFMLVEKYTALQNIVLGVEDTVGGIFITYKKAREKIKKIMDEYDLHVDLDTPITDMSVGMQQKVEILKMLYRDSEILIFDEPTAVLTEMEIEELMKIIKSLKAEGKAILFISHKLNEVREVSDRVTVLRKGKYIGTFLTKDYDNDGLAELMVGKRVNFHTEKKEATPGDVVLDIENLSVKKADSKKLAVEDFNLKVRKGEIIAVAGIDGNGQDELVAAITGLIKPKTGSIKLNGTDISKMKIKKRNTLGVNHIPGDRHKYGLVLDYNVMYNMVLETISDNRFSSGGFIKQGKVNKYSDELVQKYDVRSSMGSYTITRGMSGGNQQKVIVAREIERHGDLLIAVQPTRGLDVGAIENIHNEIVKVRDANKAVLLVSLEIDEVFDLADTIYTIYEGRITGKFKPAETTFKEIGLYETGAACQDEYKKKETEVSVEEKEKDKKEEKPQKVKLTKEETEELKKKEKEKKLKIKEEKLKQKEEKKKLKEEQKKQREEEKKKKEEEKKLQDEENLKKKNDALIEKQEKKKHKEEEKEIEKEEKILDKQDKKKEKGGDDNE